MNTLQNDLTELDPSFDWNWVEKCGPDLKKSDQSHQIHISHIFTSCVYFCLSSYELVEETKYLINVKCMA